MIKRIKENLESGFLGRIIVLGFGIYTIIWALVEPLSIEWINDNKSVWRVILIVSAIVITCVDAFFLFFNRRLERLGTEFTDTSLNLSFVSSGNPQLRISSNGLIGKFVEVVSVYNRDEVDWPLKTSAHNASTVTFIYSRTSDFYFYIRVILLSKDKTAQKFGWIRFEDKISVADIYNKQEEMACPYQAGNEDSFLKTTIDIRKAVKDTFGQGGWIYDKVVIFRVRGNCAIKSITFNK